MRTDLLLLLKERLKNVDEKNFDMGIWACGRVRCAIGEACEIKEWRDAGLWMKYGDDYASRPVVYTNSKLVIGYEAVAAILQTTREIVAAIFTGIYDNTPEDMVKVLEYVIEQNPSVDDIYTLRENLENENVKKSSLWKPKALFH